MPQSSLIDRRIAYPSVAALIIVLIYISIEGNDIVYWLAGAGILAMCVTALIFSRREHQAVDFWRAIDFASLLAAFIAIFIGIGKYQQSTYQQGNDRIVEDISGVYVNLIQAGNEIYDQCSTGKNPSPRPH